MWFQALSGLKNTKWVWPISQYILTRKKEIAGVEFWGNDVPVVSPINSISGKGDYTGN